APPPTPAARSTTFPHGWSLRPLAAVLPRDLRMDRAVFVHPGDRHLRRVESVPDAPMPVHDDDPAITAGTLVQHADCIIRRVLGAEAAFGGVGGGFRQHHAHNALAVTGRRGCTGAVVRVGA